MKAPIQIFCTSEMEMRITLSVQCNDASQSKIIKKHPRDISNLEDNSSVSTLS